MADTPYFWTDAVSSALLHLSWEELPAEDRPPKRMWDQPERLSAWFDEVKRRRDEKKPDGPGEIEDPVENPAARSLIVGGG